MNRPKRNKIDKTALMRAIAALALLLLGAGCGESEPEPIEIIQDMQQSYFALSSYEDSGVVETYIDFGESQSLVSSFFSIRFQDPALLRVDWTEAVNPLLESNTIHNVLWSNGTDTFIYWGSRQEVETQPALINGIFIASAPSGGAAHIIPSFLLPPPHRPTLPFSNLSRLKLQTSELFEGTPCHVISGQQGELLIKLWIGQEDLLLRKSEYEIGSTREMLETVRSQLAALPPEERSRYPELEEIQDSAIVSRQIHRNIKLNLPLPSSALRYVPPEEALRIK